MLAKASPCPLRFTIATEGGWDTGCILGCLLAAAFASVGAGFAGGILIGGCELYRERGDADSRRSPPVPPSYR